MLHAPTIALRPKLCRHNVSNPIFILWEYFTESSVTRRFHTSLHPGSGHSEIDLVMATPKKCKFLQLCEHRVGVQLIDFTPV